MSLSEVAKSGEYLKSLEALRDRLAEEIDSTTDSRSVAQLSKQFMDTIKEIDGIKPPDEESAASKVKRKQEQRRAAAEAENAGT